MAAIVEARNLTYRFGEHAAVDSVSLEVHAGEIFGLVGPDGAGKTTLLRLLCGLMTPSSGEASLAGQDVVRDAGAVKSSIGYMPQKFGFYTDLTIQENLEFRADLFRVSREERAQFIPELLRITGLEPFRGRAAGKLSGGMKQKLALMCTLLHRPRILILDEPTNGLDPMSRRDLWKLIYLLVKDGMTAVVSTAYLDEAERCHRVGFMDRGSLILCDTPDRVRDALTDECYEVRAENRKAARELLAGCEGIRSAQVCGPSIHAFLDPARANAAWVKDALAAGSVGLTSFERIVPSLEDVFIALAKRSSRRAASGGGVQ